MWIGEKQMFLFILMVFIHGLFACVVLLTPPSVDAREVFEFQLASKPFSPTMCKKVNKKFHIRLNIAQHRDILIRMVPGQHIPEKSDEARKKDYIHFVTLADLTNGRIEQGGIAFDQRHAVIFQEEQAKGISRTKFLSQFKENERTIADIALNTFLRLHSLFNAAVDTCRPYPSRITYGTDDEIDRIENGKQTFKKLVKHFNEHPSPPKPLYYHETGKAQGFVDPEAGKNSNVSYQAMNPLNFYDPEVSR